MKITLLQTGKTHFKFVDAGFDEFEKRLKHYCKFSHTVLELPARLKTTDVELTKKNEGQAILKQLNATDVVVLLDENGTTYNSIKFAALLQKMFLQYTSIVFVIGGAYGFSSEVYARANAKLSLSDMTFSHQLIRLIFIEQLYRAFTIIKGEPYHHQ